MLSSYYSLDIYFSGIITTQSVTQQMDKGDCVLLWYYTNKGLDKALSTYNSTNNDTLTLLCRPDGSTSLIPTSSTKESSKTATLNGRTSA